MSSQTPWQTVGPFFHYCLSWSGGADLVGGSGLGSRSDLIAEGHDQLPEHPDRRQLSGTPIEVCGRLLDGAGEPVPDAMLEIWHANDEGTYPNDMSTYGRCALDDEGRYRFLIIRPGCVVDENGKVHAPQISVGVFARGIIKRLLTRIYLSDSPENDADPVLAQVPHERRRTLIAKKSAENVYSLDIALQGENETVFFQC